MISQQSVAMVFAESTCISSIRHLRSQMYTAQVCCLPVTLIEQIYNKFIFQNKGSLVYPDCPQFVAWYSPPGQSFTCTYQNQKPSCPQCLPVSSTKGKPTNLISWLSKHASFSSSGCFVLFFQGVDFQNRRSMKQHTGVRNERINTTFNTFYR